MSSGMRTIDGVNVIPIDGLWNNVAAASTEDKLSQALEYAGCKFYDDQRKLVAGHVVALAGLGGIPIAHENETDTVISDRIIRFVRGTHEMMASSAAFSYLNNREKSLSDLYDTVTGLGHLSIAHTVNLNFIVAGISEGAELELSLQRDIVHLSKLTNARTKVQNTPPVVVHNPHHVPIVTAWYEKVAEFAESLRGDATADELEIANSFYPVSKATILMISGDLSNFRKLTQFRHDKGKEKELRAIASGLYDQLSLLWPEIINEEES